MHIIALFDDFCTSKQHSSTKEFLRKCVCSDGERPMKALYVLTKQMSNQFEVDTDAISRIIRNECDDRDLSPVAQRSTQILPNFLSARLLNPNKVALTHVSAPFLLAAHLN
jgi:hypothetical protein